MKSLLASLFLVGFVSSVNATLIDNGRFTSDSDTLLDWADLTSTAGYTYNSASSLFDTLDGGGWRYATNSEIETMFANLFSGFVDNRGNGSSDNRYAGAYSNQTADTSNFFSLFGTTYDGRGNNITYGLYRDENGILRNMGAWQEILSGRGAIYGTEFVATYDADTTYLGYYGSYIVRTNITIDDDQDGIPNSSDLCPQDAFNSCPAATQANSVPEASSLYLLTIGLLGLFGAVRRKI